MTGPLADLIKAQAIQGCAAFLQVIGRHPTEREVDMIVTAIWRCHTEPKAPSTRLQ